MYYFIGIKGSGMASLARILYDLGYEVAGSDIDKYIFLEDGLRERHIPIYSFNKDNIKDGMDVIVGNAFDRSNEEVAAAEDNPNVTIHHYYDFLAKLMDDHISIGIAGTHGKTSTTGMAYHLFKDYDKTNVLIGDGTGYATKGAKYFIAECCEYKDHFLWYHPDYSYINNIEMDHVDYFKSMEQYEQSFEKYANQAKKAIVIWGDDPHLPHLNYTKRVVKFGVKDGNDVQAKNVINNEKGLSFDVYIYGDLFGHFTLPFYGMHTLYNTLGVITLGYLEGMDFDYMQSQLSTFKGTKRRYAVKEVGNNVYVDDYAHHPTEIEATLKAAKEIGGYRVICAFQPHRYSRTKLLQDEFAVAFDSADVLYFTDIYAASEHALPGVDGHLIPELVSQHLPDTPVHYVGELDKLAEAIYEEVRPGDMVITMGAGSITRVGQKLTGLIKEKGLKK